MVGTPLLNLGTALGGLTQGYNQSQQQYMQRALQQMALDQAQRQQLAARLAGLGGIGGLLGGGNRMPMMGQPAAAPPVMNPAQQFSPNNPNNPISRIPPPSQQQPPSAQPDPAADYRPMTPGQWAAADSDLQTRDAVAAEEGLPITSEDNPPGQAGTSASPVTTTPQTKPAPGPASSAPAPAPAPAQDTGSGGNVQVTTGAGHTTDVSDLFRTIDPTALFQGLAKLAPKGTDPGVIYEAASDLIKLSNGDKSAQLQAAYLGKALGVDIANIRAGATMGAAKTAADARVGAANVAAGARVQSAEIAAAAKRDIAAASQDLRRQLADTTNKRLTAKDQMTFATTTQRLAIAAHNAGRADLAAQLNAINSQIRSIRPADGSTLDETQQAQLKQLTQEAARIGQLLATAPSIPMQAPVLAPQQ